MACFKALKEDEVCIGASRSELRQGRFGFEYMAGLNGLWLED